MVDDLMLERRGVMLVLSSPSGAGKTTIARELLSRDDKISMSVSTTTRPKRPGEVSGVDYHFVDKTEFNIKRNQQEFLESAKVFDNYYGTPAEPVMAALAEGMDILFDIDWQGTQQLAEKARYENKEGSSLDGVNLLCYHVKVTGKPENQKKRI